MPSLYSGLSPRRNGAFAKYALLVLFVAVWGNGASEPTTTATTATSTSIAAASLAAPSAPHRVTFDGARAFAHLKQQVDFGCRLPDSPAIIKTRRYIVSNLQQCGFKTAQQPFSANSQLLGREVSGVNIYGTFPAGKPVKYIVSAHYDTRPKADHDKNGHQNDPIPGANDGASGVAVLLELARVLQSSPPTSGVALVFFDLEDHGAPTDANGFCQGARYMAQNLPPELASFEVGINLDMVGDANLRIPMEGFSAQRVPQQTRDLWQIGASLHPKAFPQEVGKPVYDDHVPFQEAGHFYIDIIDFDYPDWHTVADTPDKCSAESLKAVGDVVGTYVSK